MRACKLSMQKRIYVVILIGLAVSSILRLAGGGGGSGAIWRGDGTPTQTDDAIDVAVYLLQYKNYTTTRNPAVSVFRTDVLRRYGTGRVNFLLHENAKCNFECTNDVEYNRSQHILAPCLAVTRPSYCDDHELLKCTYPQCKTMITNDETCEFTNIPFDIRQYYTTDGPQRGYLPLGPRIDSWISFQRIQQGLGRAQFVTPPSSERKFAFNAIFSQSTNPERQNLARMIEAGSMTLKLPIFSSMAKEWHPDANSDQTEQLPTDEYMGVVLDSVFTLSPAGHNPECFRLFEAIMAGSIPLLTRDDLLGNSYREGLKLPHPCANALLHWYGAPIIVLDSWDDLNSTVETLLADPGRLDEIQNKLQNWYDGYMRMIVAKFEDEFLG
ncbi:hypothetical protein ACHAXA_000404 [Cyclostephanos tholiformis]|uniref:RXYLT1 C-terminal domain-containing protein n=1 Tax=Cyclostephanos tholiformis TaxID=382380 RepID=A0ABD3RRZ0_9STRA